MKKILPLFALVVLGVFSTSCVVAIGNRPDRCEECGQKLAAECEMDCADAACVEACTEAEVAN